jgi:hypothetical protein
MEFVVAANWPFLQLSFRPQRCTKTGYRKNDLDVNQAEDGYKNGRRPTRSVTSQPESDRSTGKFNGSQY